MGLCIQGVIARLDITAQRFRPGTLSTSESSSEAFLVLTQTIQSVVGIESLESIGDIYPVTPMQNGILLSQPQEPSFYQVHTIWRLSDSSDPPDVARLVAAWRSVVAYHSILRTVFVESSLQESNFFQVVYKSVEPMLVVMNAEHPLELLSRMKKPSYTQKHPNHRLVIACSNEGRNETYCRLDISHSLVDGTSMNILERDLKLAYNQGTIGHLETAPIYARIVSHTMNQSLDKAISYWTMYLDGLDPCLFPALASHPVPISKRQCCKASFDFNDLDILSFCRANSVTLFNIVQAAWAMVLRLYTGSDDVCFGYLMSGRETSIIKVDEIIGPCINMLIQRFDFSNACMLKEVLEKVKEDFLENLQYQYCSLMSIYDALKYKVRSLFNTAISCQKLVEVHDNELPGLCLKEILSVDPAEYDIAVGAFETSSGLLIELTYWDSFLDAEQVQSLAQSLR